jgi:hypothetical protein
VNNHVAIDLSETQNPDKDICLSLFGSVKIHDQDDFFTNKYVNINQSLSIVLKPKITKTDDNLREFSPQKFEFLKDKRLFVH